MNTLLLIFGLAGIAGFVFAVVRGRGTDVGLIGLLILAGGLTASGAGAGRWANLVIALGVLVQVADFLRRYAARQDRPPTAH